MISTVCDDFGTFLSSSLIFLNLAGNRLQSLPESFCSLEKRLEILAIQGNPLSQMSHTVKQFVEGMLAYSDDDDTSSDDNDGSA